MVVFFDILLVLCVVAIACFAGYVFYRVILDD